MQRDTGSLWLRLARFLPKSFGSRSQTLPIENTQVPQDRASAKVPDGAPAGLPKWPIVALGFGAALNAAWIAFLLWQAGATVKKVVMFVAGL